MGKGIYQWRKIQNETKSGRYFYKKREVYILMIIKKSTIKILLKNINRKTNKLGHINGSPLFYSSDYVRLMCKNVCISY
ncbi:hypothetical protein C0R09_15230 [Brevibacillus laterosporus]|nr:hypothetical protein C0R09_15230 [Brevibacillus laterosporus]PCN45931.1 hypothetical protein B9C88_04420 [Brevibacillus laterosporus]